MDITRHHMSNELYLTFSSDCLIMKYNITITSSPFTSQYYSNFITLRWIMSLRMPSSGTLFFIYHDYQLMKYICLQKIYETSQILFMQHFLDILDSINAYILVCLNYFLSLLTHLTNKVYLQRVRLFIRQCLKCTSSVTNLFLNLEIVRHGCSYLSIVESHPGCIIVFLNIFYKFPIISIPKKDLLQM